MTVVTFDEALSSLLAMVGRRVEVHVLDASDSPHLVAAFGGRLEAGHSMTGGDPSDQEAIYVRLHAGDETAALSLDRELYGGGVAHPDGAVTLHVGGGDLLVSPRAE